MQRGDRPAALLRMRTNAALLTSTTASSSWPGSKVRTGTRRARAGRRRAGGAPASRGGHGRPGSPPRHRSHRRRHAAPKTQLVSRRAPRPPACVECGIEQRGRHRRVGGFGHGERGRPARVVAAVAARDVHVAAIVEQEAGGVGSGMREVAPHRVAERLVTFGCAHPGIERGDRARARERVRPMRVSASVVIASPLRAARARSLLDGRTPRGRSLVPRVPFARGPSPRSEGARGCGRRTSRRAVSRRALRARRTPTPTSCSRDDPLRAVHRRARQHGHADAVREVPEPRRPRGTPIPRSSRRSSGRPASSARRRRTSSGWRRPSRSGYGGEIPTELTTS